MALYKVKGSKYQSGGHWVTVKEGRWKGQHVFIKDGQTFDDAIAERTKHGKGLENRPVADKLAKQKATKSKFYDNLNDTDKKKYDDYLSKGYSKSDIENTLMHKTKEEEMKESGIKFAQSNKLELSDKQIEAGNRLTANAENGVRDDIKSFLSGKENYDGSQEQFINDLSDNWGVDKERVEDILHEESSKHPRLFKNERTYEQVDSEWKAQADKMEKYFDEFGTNTVEDEKKLNELSRERDRLSVNKANVLNKKMSDDVEYQRYKDSRLYGLEKTNMSYEEFNELDKKYLDKFSQEPFRTMQDGDKYVVMRNGGIHGTFSTPEEAKEYSDMLKNKYGQEQNDSSNWKDQIKDISPQDAVNELMLANHGDWNNMNQEQRDKKTREILDDFNKKYGNKFEDKKFRNQVMNQLEEENWHTMVNTIDKKYNYKPNSITEEEWEKLPNDYKGTLKDLVNTAEFRGENKEELIRQYEKQGYNVDTDKTILEYTNGGTALTPVKVPFKKYATTKREGFGTYNDDYIPVYENAIDYKGDFSRADLSKLSDDELATAIKRQHEELTKAQGERVGDRRTHNGKMDQIFKTAKINKYQTGYDKLRVEGNKRYGTIEEIKDSLSFNKKSSVEKAKPVTQTIDWSGREQTIEASKVEQMAKQGKKPRSHSYTGGGWEGTKYDSTLTTKDIAKNINDYAKKEFPGVKLNRRTDYNSLDFYVMSTPQDIFKSGSDIDKMSDKDIDDTLYKTYGGVRKLDDWLDKNNRKSAQGTYTNKDVRDYLKEELNTYKSRKEQTATGNEWYLNDYGKNLLSSLNKEMNSYNYDDSDGMVDYFDTNFYGYVKIGKWEKPYEVTPTTTKAMNMSKLVQSYVDRGYSEETARKMAKQAINKRKRK